MHKLEVFFDYACPYCLRGHEYLKELHPRYPQIEIVWRPCEAHPRPDRYGPHSDLCIRGMFFAAEHGADLWAYHEKMFHAVFTDRVNIDDIHAVAGVVKGLLDADTFQKSLQNGEYQKELQQANHYAYEEQGVWAVPSYRMAGRRFDSIENIGVSLQELAAFMEGAK